VLVVSTSHVYRPVTHDSPRVDETAPLDPRTGYARSKFLAEEETRLAVDQLGCDAVVVRSFNHTGPGQTPRLMLPQWARQLTAGGSQPIEVYTRDAWLDMTDVRDVVRAYRLVVEHGQRGTTYNVGSGVNRRSGDILDLLRTLAGQPDRPAVELRPGLVQTPVADNTRLVRATGWRPEIPLEKTVIDTLQWWREKVDRK
jgi:GDP-4-dehydro-6-deoxy-D-mannose reductase